MGTVDITGSYCLVNKLFYREHHFPALDTHANVYVPLNTAVEASHLSCCLLHTVLSPGKRQAGEANATPPLLPLPCASVISNSELVNC